MPSPQPALSDSVAAGAGRRLLARRPWIASHGILAVVLISCLAVLAHDLFRTWEARARVLEQARLETENLAWGASQQAEGAFGLVSALLGGLVERATVDGMDTPQLDRLRAVMAEGLATSPSLEDLVLVDQNGFAIVDGKPSTRHIDLGDRSYFTYLKDHAITAPYFGEAIDSRLTGRRIIPVARRIDRPDGSFAGIAIATVEVRFFLDFYRTFKLGKDGLAALVRTDGSLLVRQPAPLERVSRSGDIIRQRAALFSTSPTATIESVSPLDGINRIMSYRPIEGYPVTVVMALGTDEQLTGWRSNAAGHLLGTVLLTLLLGLVGNRLAGEIRRTSAVHRESAVAAAANNEDLTRLSRHLALARDRAEAASRAKSRFLAGMSHELRTPLNGVLGYASLLRSEGGLTPTQTARIDAMQQAGKHLLEMITCVLDLSEIEAGHAELRKVAFDAQAVAAACLDLVRPAAEAKRLLLSVVVQAGAPTQLLTDPTRLRQVLLNLLGNAVKFTEQGSIEVRLRCSTASGALRIEVCDTGPGIPPLQRCRLFQDFERLDHRLNNGIEGAGLGLALSSGVAQMMGGRLHYQDNPGGGSIFWLELPLIAVDSCAALQRDAPPWQASMQQATAQEPARRTAPLSILLADDVAMNRDIAGAMLRAAGHRVLCVDDGLEAVAAAAATDFDAVLLDVRMPNVDGLEAARRIRGLPGLRGQVPIVALTAQAFADQLALCTAAGMNDYLLKPFEPEALLEALTRVVVDRADHGSTEIAKTAAPAPAVVGFNLATLDREVFERTGSYLPSERVAQYVQTIRERANSLLGKIHDAASSPVVAPDLIAEAHTLAGSAGMFGFVRLAEISRRFESAVKASTAEVPSLLDGLRAALEATLDEIGPPLAGASTC